MLPCNSGHPAARPASGLATLAVLAGLFVFVPEGRTRALYGAAAPSAEDAARVLRLDLRGRGFRGSCTGTLVSATWVLTAGHCARTAQHGPLTMRSVTPGRGRRMRTPNARFLVDPAFDPARPERGHDFALVELPRALQRMTPTVLDTEPRNHMLAGPRVRVVGYGATRRAARGGTRLRSAGMEWLSPFACFSGDVPGMARTRACAISPAAGVCPGDSGAPVFVGEGDATRLAGVVSLAVHGQARCVQSMAVFGHMDAARDWVGEHVRP